LRERPGRVFWAVCRLKRCLGSGKNSGRVKKKTCTTLIDEGSARPHRSTYQCFNQGHETQRPTRRLKQPTQEKIHATIDQTISHQSKQKPCRRRRGPWAWKTVDSHSKTASASDFRKPALTESKCPNALCHGRGQRPPERKQDEIEVATTGASSKPLHFPWLDSSRPLLQSGTDAFRPMEVKSNRRSEADPHLGQSIK